ncbi:MAG: hypothetical protein R3E32_09400 [Chitinophagales bacterium]
MEKEDTDRKNLYNVWFVQTIRQEYRGIEGKKRVLKNQKSSLDCMSSELLLADTNSITDFADNSDYTDKQDFAY